MVERNNQVNIFELIDEKEAIIKFQNFGCFHPLVKENVQIVRAHIGLGIKIMIEQIMEDFIVKTAKTNGHSEKEQYFKKQDFNFA